MKHKSEIHPLNSQISINIHRYCESAFFNCFLRLFQFRFDHFEFSRFSCFRCSLLGLLMSLLWRQVRQAATFVETLIFGVSRLATVSAYRHATVKCTKGLLCGALLQVVNLRLHVSNQRSVVDSLIVVFRCCMVNGELHNMCQRLLCWWKHRYHRFECPVWQTK